LSCFALPYSNKYSIKNESAERTKANKIKVKRQANDQISYASIREGSANSIYHNTTNTDTTTNNNNNNNQIK
jgi:hypothetical protein